MWYPSSLKRHEISGPTLKTIVFSTPPHPKEKDKFTIKQRLLLQGEEQCSMLQKKIWNDQKLKGSLLWRIVNYLRFVKAFNTWTSCVGGKNWLTCASFQRRHKGEGPIRKIAIIWSKTVKNKYRKKNKAEYKGGG